MGKSKGFTLIELLVVIVVIGVLVSMATLSMGSGDRRDWQRHEAERLLRLFQLSSQESMIRGMPIAVELFAHGYRFLHPEGDKWQPEERDGIFKPRVLQAQLTFNLNVDNQSILLNNDSPASIRSNPQIVIAEDGEINPFLIRVKLDGSDEIFELENNAEQGLTLKKTDIQSARL